MLQKGKAHLRRAALSGDRSYSSCCILHIQYIHVRAYTCKLFQGHASPHGSPPPPPLSASDSEGGEDETLEPGPSTENLALDADAESSHTSSSDRAKSISSKATSRASSKASSKATLRASTVKDDSSSPDASTIGQSVPLDLDQGKFFWELFNEF